MTSIKNTKGETMSAFNRGTVHRRLGLLAGGSLAAATIVITGAGAALTPSAAFAANECAPIATAPSANGPTADTFTCAGPYTATGITYSSAGPLTVNSTGSMNVGVNGVNLTGNGADTVTFTATGTVTGASGPTIDIATDTGAIDVRVAGVTATTTGLTGSSHAIRALSAGGQIDIVATGTVNSNSTNVAFTTGDSGIEARSTAGSAAVNITTSGTVSGRLRGIYAQASGTGALTITAGGAVNTNSTAGVANIDAVTGTGLLTINLTAADSANLIGNAGTSVRTSAGGNAAINVGAGRSLTTSTASSGTINASAVGTTTINNAGTINSGATSVAILAAGGAIAINNDGRITGRVNFTGVTGASNFSNNASGSWSTGGTSAFGPGTATLTNAGTLIVNSAATFTGLEAFDNTGTIQFNGTGVRVLSAPGAAFTGSGHLSIEATLGAAGQASCSVATVADCLGLVGGQTSGVTRVLLTSVGAVGIEANAGIVLVDVAGGESHAGDFVLDVTSPNYAPDTVYDGVIVTDGVLAYALQYDADTQQHVLSSVIPGQRLEYVAAMQEVLSIWRSTSDTVAGRQADLQNGGVGGAWLRVTGENATRDVDVAISAGGGAFRYADEYDVRTVTVIGGFDLASGGMGGGDFVVGLHGGYINSTLERASSSTSDKIDGATAGFYGGWWSDGLTLDGTLNLNFLSLDHDRSIEEVSTTNVLSIGARAEAGWRFAVSDGFYVQPLATAAYVDAQIEEVIQTNFEASYEDVASLSAALGLRIGGDVGPLGYWVTGRAWKEFAGDGVLMLGTTAEDVALRDDLSGDFQELNLGLSLSNGDDTLSGFFSGGARFADSADDYSLSFGARLRW